MEWPLILAPAMNTMMWNHPKTSCNLDTLGRWDVTVVPRVEKTLVCGDKGTGAMAGLDTIEAAIQTSTNPSNFKSSPPPIQTSTNPPNLASTPPPRVIALLSCGSFNPPTIMHLRLFKLVRDYFGQKDPQAKVIGVISPTNDKYVKPTLIPGTHRLEMARRAVEGSDWVNVLDWEVEPTKELSRTIVLMNSCGWLLRAAQLTSPSSCCAEPTFWRPSVFPACGNPRICEITGSLLSPGKAPIQFVRETQVLNDHQLNVDIVTESIKNEVSSTKIRTAVAQGNSIKYLVPERVISYICKNDLYKAA